MVYGDGFKDEDLLPSRMQKLNLLDEDMDHNSIEFCELSKSERKDMISMLIITQTQEEEEACKPSFRRSHCIREVSKL